MKVLFVGFSVTAATPGYYFELKKLREKGHIEFDVDFIGLGGVHLHQLCYIYDELISQKSPDHIVFEVLTSGHRKNDDGMGDRLYKEPFLSVLKSSLKKCSNIALLNLFRKDVDYEVDLMTKVYDDIAKAYNIPVIEMSKNFLSMIDKGNIDDYIWDVVHTTKLGARTYADEIIQYFSNLEQKPRINGELIQSDVTKMYTSESYNPKKEFAFLGKGFFIDFQMITPQKPLFYQLDNSIDIEEICFITGPNSGDLVLEINQNERVELAPYDSHSYYERVYFKPIGLKNVSNIKLSLDINAPSLELKKGEWDLSSRFVKFVCFCVKNVQTT